MEALLRDPEVVHLVECREKATEEEKSYFTEKIIEYCELTYGIENYYGGADSLKIEWIEVGEKFRIQEFDGAESIEYLNKVTWLVA